MWRNGLQGRINLFNLVFCALKPASLPCTEFKVISMNNQNRVSQLPTKGAWTDSFSAWEFASSRFRYRDYKEKLFRSSVPTFKLNILQCDKALNRFDDCPPTNILNILRNLLRLLLISYLRKVHWSLRRLPKDNPSYLSAIITAYLSIPFRAESRQASSVRCYNNVVRCHHLKIPTIREKWLTAWLWSAWQYSSVDIFGRIEGADKLPIPTYLSIGRFNYLFSVFPYRYFVKNRLISECQLRFFIVLQRDGEDFRRESVGRLGCYQLSLAKSREL